jgi:hypothetical protein
VLLDFGREAEQAHDLGHPGPGDALAPGDRGLVGFLAGFEEAYSAKTPYGSKQIRVDNAEWLSPRPMQVIRPGGACLESDGEANC